MWPQWSKLLRVAMLLPVVALVGIYFGRREGGQSSSLLATVPWFLLVVAALVIVISLHWVPPPLITAMQDTSRWCLVVAIPGLGVKTSIQQLAQVGWRPIAVLLANTVFLAVFAGTMLARLTRAIACRAHRFPVNAPSTCSACLAICSCICRNMFFDCSR